jgi:hypothetical protein
MKKTLLIITVLAGIGLSSCSNPGCTDIDATNYSAKAKTNDGSCTYSEKLVIWQSSATSLLEQADGITGVQIYIDGQFSGSFLSTNYFTAEPTCSQTGNFSTTIDMGNYNTDYITLEFKDQNGNLIDSQLYNMIAGTCNTYEIFY